MTSYDAVPIESLAEMDTATAKDSRRADKDAPEAQTPLEHAEAAAKRRGKFFGHVVIWGAVTLFLLVTAGFEGASTVALMWGIFLAYRGYQVVIAPDLENKWIAEELKRRQMRDAIQKPELPAKASRSLEELSASIAHEIRNPITAAKSLVQQIGEDPRSEENVEYAKIALTELDRVERSISHLLRYAREEAVAVEEVRLVEVVDSALESFKDRLSRLRVDIGREHDGEGALLADPEKLRRVVINLVGNALDAMDEAKTAAPALRISSGRNLAGTEHWLKIRDNGPGIERERLEKIFSPFHTSKANGTGLGLAISKKLVDAHGGQIEIDSALGQYTEFTVVLPIRKRPVEGRA